jgi:uncharacterized membrane protein
MATAYACLSDLVFSLLVSSFVQLIISKWTSRLLMKDYETIPENHINQLFVREGTISTLHVLSTSSQSLMQLPSEVAFVEGGRARVGITHCTAGEKGLTLSGSY